MTPRIPASEPGCLCGLEGPDSFGNYDLLVHSDCPLHAGAQLDLDGNPTPVPPPAYDRDANAETTRLFDFPQGIRGQLALDTDPDD